MSIVNKATLDALTLSWKVVFQEALAGLTPQHTRIATRFPSTGANQAYPFAALLGSIKEWLGDRIFETLGAWSKTLENRSWQEGISIQRKEIEDDQIGIYEPAVRGVAEHWNLHPWDLALEVLNYDAFGTNKKGLAVTGFDAVAFFSASHTWPGAAYTTSQSNLATGDLTQAAIDAMDVATPGFRKPNGDYIDSYMDTLVIGTGLQSTARALFLIPTLASGAGNPMYNRFTKDQIIVHPTVRPGRWICLNTGGVVKPLVFQDRQPLRYTAMIGDEDEAVFTRDQYRWGWDARYTMGALAWWLAYASDGSATTTA